MRSSKKSKRQSRVRKSLLPVTATGKGKGGRSELHSLRQKVHPSCFLTQTETFNRLNCLGCFHFQNLMRSLLGKNSSQSFQAEELLSHFCRGYFLDFCSDCELRPRQGLKSSREKRCKSGKKTDGSSMLKSYGKHSKEAIESAKYL